MLIPSYYDTVVKMFDEGSLQKEIADFLGIKAAALAFQMKKVGFSFKRKSYTLSEVQIKELVERYSSGESTPSICKDLPCSNDTALKVLRENGVVVKGKEDLKFYKGYTINEEAFSDVNEEECAYFYGWILTDGCLTKRSVSIELSSVDEELLLNLKTYLNSSSSIRTRSRLDSRTGNTYHQSSFAFSHTTILDRLKQFGLEPRKSLLEKCPDVFKYNRHFWRGVVEGDGHIAKKSNSLELCGGPELVESFANYCKFLVKDYEPTFTMNGKMNVVRIRSKDACKLILDELYKDCEFKLSRKYNVYLERYWDGTNPS